MIGSFLTRGLVMILGYAYPAYECFKTLERNKPDIEQLRFWCQYWILIAVMTVFERVGDAFVSWLPMYGEAKLAFILYLWFPKTKGTTFVYNSFFQPYVSKHETEIDRNLLELRSRAGDLVAMYSQRVVSFGQTRVFEILQFVASQSAPKSHPTQVEQKAPTATASPAAPPPRQPSTTEQNSQPHPLVEEPLSPTSSTSSSPQEDEMEIEQSSISSRAPPSPVPSPLKKSVSMPIAPGSPRRPVTKKVETMQQVVTVPPKAGKSLAKILAAPEETVMEETIRVTRGRLRKTRSIAETK